MKRRGHDERSAVKATCLWLVGRFALVVIAFFLMCALIVLFGPRADSQPTPLPKPLEALCQRIEADDNSPAWKKGLVPEIRSRNIGLVTGNVTCYLPSCPANCGECARCKADPYSGGPNAFWGFRLRWGHAAVDRSVIPLGSVLCVEGVDQLLIAVDIGGAIDGHAIDIACASPAHYRQMAQRFSHAKTNVWILGRITKEESK